MTFPKDSETIPQTRPLSYSFAVLFDHENAGPGHLFSRYFLRLPYSWLIGGLSLKHEVNLGPQERRSYECFVRALSIIIILFFTFSFLGIANEEAPSEKQKPRTLRRLIKNEIKELKEATWILILGVHAKTSFLGKGSFGPYVGLTRKSSRESPLSFGLYTKVSLGKEGHSISLLPAMLYQFGESKTMHPHFGVGLGPSLIRYKAFNNQTKLTFKAVAALGVDFYLSERTAMRFQARFLYWDRSVVGAYSLYVFAPHFALGFVL